MGQARTQDDTNWDRGVPITLIRGGVTLTTILNLVVIALFSCFPHLRLSTLALLESVRSGCETEPSGRKKGWRQKHFPSPNIALALILAHLSFPEVAVFACHLSVSVRSLSKTHFFNYSMMWKFWSFVRYCSKPRKLLPYNVPALINVFLYWIISPQCQCRDCRPSSENLSLQIMAPSAPLAFGRYAGLWWIFCNVARQHFSRRVHGFGLFATIGTACLTNLWRKQVGMLFQLPLLVFCSHLNYDVWEEEKNVSRRVELNESAGDGWSAVL